MYTYIHTDLYHHTLVQVLECQVNPSETYSRLLIAISKGIYYRIVTQCQQE